MSLHERFAALVAECPAAPAWLGEGACDRASFWQRVRVAAATFAGDRGRIVAFACADGPELATALIGCMLSGATAFPIPPTATEHERRALLDGLDLARTVSEVALPDDALAAWPVPPAGADVALLVATSGSSGTPKRVGLTYAGLMWNASAHAESVGLGPETRSLSLSPLYHAFPLVAVVLGTLLAGGAVAFARPPFTPRAFVRQVLEAQIGYAALPPTLFQLLQTRFPSGTTLPATISVGAAPVSPTELLAMAAWAALGGARLYHTYGLSEAGPRVATLAPDDLASRPTSVGRPLPGVRVEIRIDGRAVPAHGEGEIWLMSPSLMSGYWPESPGSGLGADGWLPTGDLGFLDAEGFLHLRGRLKDVIVTGGTNVSAREIELALLADPCVADAAVVGVPHGVYGEVPRAYVVTRGDATPETLLRHLAGLLSRAKLPQSIAIVTELPRTSLGKIDKPRLKEAACEASP